MLSELRVQNFRALKDVTVRLGPFNVLIGLNDSGKTSFLEAVYAISRSIRQGLYTCFWHPLEERQLVYKQQGTLVKFAAALRGNRNDAEFVRYLLELRINPPHLEVMREMVDDAPFTEPSAPSSVTRMYGFSQGSGSHIPDWHSLARKVLDSLPGAVLTRWDVEELAADSRLPPNNEQPFDPTGNGLSACLAQLKLADYELFHKIETHFLELFPEYSTIGFVPVSTTSWHRDGVNRRVSASGEGYRMFFTRQDKTRLPADAVSGGSLMVLAFLTMAYLNHGLLLVEEPENGLHPARLEQVVEMLRMGLNARPESQVIITTHSPYLLDYCKPEEVRLFAKNEGGDVEVFHLEDYPDIGDRLRYAMLGEVVFGDWDDLLREFREHAHSGPGGGAT